jgi:hypothetical protein
MSKEKLESHLTHLKQKHATIDKTIKDGYTHYLTDKGLQKMKFEKAALKREIVDIEKQLAGY